MLEIVKDRSQLMMESEMSAHAEEQNELTEEFRADVIPAICAKQLL
jgi:hypothetical protein